MSAEPSYDESTPNAAVRSRWLRLAGFGFGVACLAGAVAAARSAPEQFTQAVDALRDPPPASVALVLASVAVGLALTGCFFALLTRRFARIPMLEMQALIASSTLANYLPLKPGLLGRVAYQSARYGVRPADSIRTVVEAIVMSASVAGAFLLSSVLVGAVGIDGGWSLVLPAAVSAGLAAPRTRLWAQAFLLRQAELALWTLRYWAVFRLVGAPVGLDAAVVLAGASVLATLVPFVSNGLGIREWTIAFIAPALAHGTVSPSQAIVAELVHRAAELAVTVPVGLVALGYLARRARSAEKHHG
jgi:uncharacterized membrane protein YbhN (UPF0104 family)